MVTLPLLPPKVLGPVSAISPQITVVGQQPGVTVQLYANGTAIGPLTDSPGTSVAVSLPGGTLLAGQGLTAKQVYQAHSSDATPTPETVNAAPSSLQPPVFLSLAHTCIDWIVIGGVTPGVTVTVTHNGDIVGEALATRALSSVRMKFVKPFLQGNILIANQHFTIGGNTVQSQPTPSLQAEQLFTDHGPQLTAPTIAQPPLECDGAVLVSNLEQGSTLLLTQKTNGTSTYPYPFVNSTVWANTNPLPPPPATVSVAQEFQNCKLQSPSGPDVPIASKPPGPPTVKDPICPDASYIHVSGLRIGDTVNVEARKYFDNNTAQFLPIGSGGAWASEYDLPLPVGWLSQAQFSPQMGKLVMVVTASNCSGGSPESNFAKIEGLLWSPPPDPEIHHPPLYECARWVEVDGTIPGALVTLHSDQPDAKQLSAPTLVFASTVPIPTYRPLRKGETVTATMAGCSGDSATSSGAPVEAAPKLNAPTVRTPLRGWAVGAWIDNVVPGARVHAYINNIWKNSVDSWDTSVWVPLGQLQADKETVSALQTLCTEVSAMGVTKVTFGQMKTVHQPSPLLQGRPVTFEMVATDADNGNAVSGQVFINNTSVGMTGQQITRTFPPAQPGPPAFVRAYGYADAQINWLLVASVPSMAMLTLQFTDNVAYTTASSVQWVVYNSYGLSDLQHTQVASASGNTAQIPLPSTPASNTVYLVTCSVKVSLSDGSSTSAVIQTTSYGMQNASPIGWTGTNETAQFGLSYQQLVDGNGNPYDYFWVEFFGVN